jgi:hypothetical protein
MQSGSWTISLEPLPHSHCLQSFSSPHHRTSLSYPLQQSHPSLRPASKRLLAATKGLPAAIAKGLLHLLAFFLLDTCPKGIDHL